MAQTFTIGLPRMHKEAGERRDFLPGFVGRLEQLGFHPVLEHGYGSGMGMSEKIYRKAAGDVEFAPLVNVYGQDYVLLLRCPDDEYLKAMKAGACLISMLHYPTRPGRTEFIRSLGLEAVSLDSIKDDSGRRLVENLSAVAWNGTEAAFEALRKQYPDPPGFESTGRPPIRVTLLGAGQVGANVVKAAIRYGNEDLHRRLVGAGVPGVQVIVVDHDLTGNEPYMLELLSHTDILVDATLRPDPSRLVIPNHWIGKMPEHAVLLDLSVDPYDFSHDTPIVKGIEGMPQGDLNQYVFLPGDPVFDALPVHIDTTHRRTSVSCYSWPGIYPYDCMEVYGKQLAPLIRAISEAGGIGNINPHGRFFHRAIAGAMLSRWAVEDGKE